MQNRLNRSIQKHWRLTILEFMSLFLRSPSSKLDLSLHLGVKLFQMNASHISLLNSFEKETVSIRFIMLKRLFFLHEIRHFLYKWCLLQSFFKCVFSYCKKSVDLIFLRYLLLNQYIWYLRQPLYFLSEKFCCNLIFCFIWC